MARGTDPDPEAQPDGPNGSRQGPPPPPQRPSRPAEPHDRPLRNPPADPGGSN